MKNIMKPFALATLAVLAFAGCMTEKERQAIAAEKVRQEQLAKAELERQEQLARIERERQKREALSQKKLKAKQLMAEQKWQEVVDLCGNENDAELVGHVKIARCHLAQEALRRARAERVEALAASSLKDAREAYSRGLVYKCPFPRKDRERDWLAKWTEPRLELSDEDKLAGESRLEAFGTKYLPNAYANYEKVRDAARELQLVFNEEFPEPWTITSTSPKWSAFNKVLEKFAKVRTEYFLCRDELCHYWLAHRLGVLSAEDFAKIDSQRLAVQLLPVNVKLIGFPWLEITPMEAKYNEFAAKYAPESFAIYQKFEREFKETDKLLEDVFKQCSQIDHVRFDRALRAAASKRNDLVREMNLLLMAFQTWRSEHRTTVKSSEEVAQSDHATALRLKPFLDSLPTYVKERALGPVIPKRDMIAIPGKDYKMQRTEVTQLQWMIVTGSNPSYRGGLPDNPVENVSWDDCKQFIEKLNARPEVKSSGLKYRLPTEEEWKYACRAGSTGAWGRRMNGEEGPLDVMGWHAGNSGGGHQPVAMKEPNAFGLYDMHGNVWEWCEDLDEVNRSYRVYRGGSWEHHLGHWGVGDRSGGYPDHRSGSLGFRLAASQD